MHKAVYRERKLCHYAAAFATHLRSTAISDRTTLFCNCMNDTYVVLKLMLCNIIAVLTGVTLSASAIVLYLFATLESGGNLLHSVHGSEMVA